MTSLAEEFSQSANDPDELNAEFIRPLMVEANVSHVFRQDGLCYPADPQYQRKRSNSVAVTAHSATGQLDSQHELAWKYIVDASDIVEFQLRSALWAECKKNFDEFIAEIELDDPECEWESMKNITDWSSESSLDRQVYLYHISLLDSSEHNVAHVVFTFDIGWDDEHGLCVVMHKDRVLAINGAGDHCF